MAISKNQKTELIANLKDSLEQSSFAVIIQYRGIDGKQLYDIRVSLKSKKCGMKIAKNTLAKIAIKDTQFEALSPYLKGPTAILYSQDPVALAKIVIEAKKKNECLKIEAGFLDKAIIKEDTISSLAKLGSLEEVRASFLGLLGVVQSNFVRTLGAPQAGFAPLFAGEVQAKQE